MRGTRGYLAPEWISGVAITAKADVYSCGMMLFEFVSGRRNSEEFEDGKEEELARLCKVACWCIQDDETHRPSMGQVGQILEGVLDVTLPPIPRALQVMVESKSNNSTASSQAKSTTLSRSS
ncbi:hypothetical protein WN943_010921 [Citrus x changshan-huyou]